MNGALALEDCVPPRAGSEADFADAVSFCVVEVAVVGGEGIDRVVCFGDYLAFDVVGNLVDFEVLSCVVEVAFVGGEGIDIVVCFGDYLSLGVVGDLADFAVLSCVVEVALVGGECRDPTV